MLLPRLVLLSVALGTATLTACSSTTSGSGTGSSATPTTAAATSTTASATTSTDSSTATGVTTRLEALCAATNAKVKQLPTPSGPTDFAAIATWAPQTLILHAEFVASAQKLLAGGTDTAELRTRFIGADSADFDRAAPIIAQMGPAARAHDAARLSMLVDSLTKLPDHSTAIANYLTSKGLTACADLESS